MKRMSLVIMAILALALMVVPASATFVQNFSINSTESGGLPVSAKAIATITDGHVTIDVWNTQADETSVAQNISDLFFTLINTDGSAAPTFAGSTAGSSGGGVERTVAAGGSFSDDAYSYAAPNNLTFENTLWTLDNTLPGTSLTGWHLNGLGVKIPGATPPNSTVAHTILGLPAYPNDAIGGSAPHNPFLFGTDGSVAGSPTPIEFVLDIPGVTQELTRIDTFVFSFGTTAGNNVVVPIPPTVLLMGSGLLGLGLVGWRRRSHPV